MITNDSPPSLAIEMHIMDKTTNNEVEQLITRITKLMDSQKQQVLQEVTSMLESSVSKTAPDTNIFRDSVTSDDSLTEFHALMMEPNERPSDYFKRLHSFIQELFQNDTKDHNLSSLIYKQVKCGCTDPKLLQKLSSMDTSAHDFGTLLHNVNIIEAKRTRAKLMSKQTEVPVIPSKRSRTNTQKNSVSLPEPRLHLSAKDGGSTSLNATPRSSIWAPSICPYSCFKCGCYGHIARFCRYKRNPQLVKHTTKKYVLPADVMDMEVNWSEEQGKDKTVARVINIITTKQHVNARAETKEVLKLLRKRRKLLLIDNILCRIIHGKSAVQIVMPTHLHQLVMNKFHNDNDHLD